MNAIHEKTLFANFDRRSALIVLKNINHDENDDYHADNHDDDYDIVKVIDDYFARRRPLF